MRASKLPISIIIAGINDLKDDPDHFKFMDELDADINPIFIQQTQEYQSRDCVQFVPVIQVIYDDKLNLKKEILNEFPRQLTEYFDSKNIEPQESRQNRQGTQSTNSDFFENLVNEQIDEVFRSIKDIEEEDEDQ